MLWAENRLLLAGGAERQCWSCCSSENRSAPVISVSIAIKIPSKGVNNLQIREILKIDSTLLPYQGNNPDKQSKSFWLLKSQDRALQALERRKPKTNPRTIKNCAMKVCNKIPQIWFEMWSKYWLEHTWRNTRPTKWTCMCQLLCSSISLLYLARWFQACQSKVSLTVFLLYLLPRITVTVAWGFYSVNDNVRW